MRPLTTRPERISASQFQQLNSLDTVFLAVENPTNPMNIGTVGIFDGPMPAFCELFDIVAHRITAVPRCRQRIRRPIGPLGRPVWIDDVHFDPLQHVDAVSLANGDEVAFTAMVADFVAEPLDRRRPLWQIRLINGLDNGQWAVVAKVHHCMVDGIAGSDLLSAIMASAPSSSPHLPDDPWLPSPEPSKWSLMSFTTQTAVGSLVVRVQGALLVLRHPFQTWNRIRIVIAAARELWYRQEHRPTSLVGVIGTTRRWAHFLVPLDQVRTIQSKLEGTVNDVVITAVACGLHDLLENRGETTTDRVVTAMVPVSLRPLSDRGETGNRVANVHARIPIDISDLRSLARDVHRHLDGLKSSHQVDATGLVMHIGRYTPTFIADRIARVIFHRQRTVETVITNVPGPPAPLYFGTHEMIEAYPVAPIGGLVRITIAIWSYSDMLSFGITCDRDATTDDDLSALVDGIQKGLTGLADLASEQ